MSAFYLDGCALGRRHDRDTVEGRIFAWIRRLSRARAATPALRTGGDGGIAHVDSPHVLGWWRRHPRTGAFVGLANVAEHTVTVDAGILDSVGGPAAVTVLSSDGPPTVVDGRLHVPPLGFLWLAEPATAAGSSTAAG